jgi:DnaJ-domain-containing protein 1
MGILLRQDFNVKIRKAMKNTKTRKAMNYVKNTKAMKHIEKKTTLLSG